MAAVLPNPTHQ